MNVYGILRTAALAAVLLGATADARRAGKTLCDADPTHAPAVVTASPGLKGSVVPTVPAATTPAGKVPVPAPVAPIATEPATITAAPGAGKAPVVAPATTKAPTTTAPANTEAPKKDTSNGAVTVAPAKEPATVAPATTTPSAGGAAQSKTGTTKAKFTYTGKDAGGPGSYQMVTDFATCAKTAQTTTNAVSPLDDDVTVVFRGPMTIFNIAVFDGSSGGAWTKVSSYEKGGAASNLVFLNNRNVDFAGKSSPQGFATDDGKGTAAQSTPFKGVLGAATNPTSQSIFADEKTGAEVHIMSGKQCGTDGVACKGYYDKDGTAFQGWGGAKKIFVTKVTMPNGGAPNVPAIWMLNAQVVRASQYQCNCRGMGKSGGCGELDIAEVLEKDTSVVATHYYFYDGGAAPGHDAWSKRPVDAPATYVTIIDEAHGVTVLELGGDDFDFSSASISKDVVAQWQQKA